jgi:hypothetical protein
MLSACVSVHVSDPTGGVRVMRSIGMVRVELPQTGRSVTGAIHGVGLVQAPLGWTLGYTQQRWAVLESDCRTVVWLPQGAVEPSVVRALAQAAGVCLMAADARLRVLVDSDKE